MFKLASSKTGTMAVYSSNSNFFIGSIQILNVKTSNERDRSIQSRQTFFVACWYSTRKNNKINFNLTYVYIFLGAISISCHTSRYNDEKNN